MSGPQQISWAGLAICLGLMLIPLTLDRIFKLHILRPVITSLFRMAVQLFLMGIYLRYLLEWDLPWLNASWFFIIVVVASFSVTQNSGLKKKVFLGPVFLSILISVLLVILIFNKWVLNLESVLSARYFIVVGGMMMGNSMKGNIVGVSGFYRELKRNQERYRFRLAAGATVYEGVLPYLRNGIKTAMRPMIASMATVGLVHSPGMMTGQILGGSSPMTAITYQIAIMATIFTIMSLSVTLNIIFTIKRAFDEYGMLKTDIFTE